MSQPGWYYVKLLGFSAFPAIPLLAPIGYYAHLPWLSPVFVFAVIPVLELGSVAVAVSVRSPHPTLPLMMEGSRPVAL